MSKGLNARAAAAKISWQIIDGGTSLDAALQQFFDVHPEADRGLIQELVYGVCRWYGELDVISVELLNRPIKRKERVVHFVLLVGLYQLSHLNMAPHAAVSETVNACQQLGKGWAKSLVNGCLRRWIREADSLTVMDRDKVTHPDWLWDSIHAYWPEHTEQVVCANNERPPMILRVNRRKRSRQAYLADLSANQIGAQADHRSADAITLDKPIPVHELPGFSEGLVSVQDIAAQIAADLLPIRANDAVLDACAAPGGKAAHLQERSNNQLQLDALDISEPRTQRLRETFQRLELSANVYCADASKTPSWPVPDDGYDHIVIDAPCSGTGVIRRHPDIRHHRRPEDITALCRTQENLLISLWPLLKPGGHLLYLTCSILPPENSEQIAAFLGSTASAQLVPIDHPDAITLTTGVQTLPGVHDMDGFFYALLRKIQ